jgi:hypothetical protein
MGLCANRTVELALKVKLSPWATLTPAVRQYLLVTGNYWAFTLTDGALRMLVVLFFHALGYSRWKSRCCSCSTNSSASSPTCSAAGWASHRAEPTMNIGPGPAGRRAADAAGGPALLTVLWVMAAQALSGIAKDLNKMSAKSASSCWCRKGPRARCTAGWRVLTGLQERAQGRGFLPGRGAAGGCRLSGRGADHGGAAGAGVAGSLIAAETGSGQEASFKPKFREIFSKQPGHQPAVRPRGCSCSAPAMSGSWWRCRCT